MSILSVLGATGICFSVEVTVHLHVLATLVFITVPVMEIIFAQFLTGKYRFLLCMSLSWQLCCSLILQEQKKAGDRSGNVREGLTEPCSYGVKLSFCFHCH